MMTYINKYMRQRFVLVQLIAIVLLSIFNFQSYDNFTLVSNILFTMEVIHTQQGRPQIVFDNYIYGKNIHAQTYIRWECNKRRYENCKAGIKTDLQMMSPIHFG